MRARVAERRAVISHRIGDTRILANGNFAGGHATALHLDTFGSADEARPDGDSIRRKSRSLAGAGVDMWRLSLRQPDDHSNHTGPRPKAAPEFGREHIAFVSKKTWAPAITVRELQTGAENNAYTIAIRTSLPANFCSGQ